MTETSKEMVATGSTTRILRMGATHIPQRQVYRWPGDLDSDSDPRKWKALGFLGIPPWNGPQNTGPQTTN